jgi:hypothetical protein
MLRTATALIKHLHILDHKDHLDTLRCFENVIHICLLNLHPAS